MKINIKDGDQPFELRLTSEEYQALKSMIWLIDKRFFKQDSDGNWYWRKDSSISFTEEDMDNLKRIQKAINEIE